MQIASTLTQEEQQPLRASFLGLVRAELMKITWLRQFWVLFILGTIAFLLLYIWETFDHSTGTQIHQDATGFFYGIFLGLDLQMFRALSGIFVMVIAVYLAGQEYQLGTLRILLGRGVGRVQLLLSKIVALFLMALFLLVLGLLVNLILLVLMVGISTGSLAGLSGFSARFMADFGIFSLGILFNMWVSILLATAMTVIGRSITFGLCIAMIWFPVDNGGALFMTLAKGLFAGLLPKMTVVLLGPNLNALGAQFLSAPMRPLGITPAIPTSGLQMLGVTLVYVVIFLVSSILLTWKRDVHA